jgi:hypothetical protein
MADVKFNLITVVKDTHYMENIIHVIQIQSEVLEYHNVCVSFYKVWSLNKCAAATCRGDGWLFSAVVLKV